MTQALWIQRRFNFDMPVSLWPNVLERVRGTPARVEDRLRTIPAALLPIRHRESWSIQENVGHLLNTETLFHGRMEDYAKGLHVLRPADMENRATGLADFNSQPLEAILGRFRASRERLVEALEAIGEEGIGRSAVHPRLNQPMRVIDMMVFIAEHDDHHLARISELLRVLDAGA
jgi:uncharacterized damage-inducible protein DinB